jgi:hypothetical protein
MSETLRRVQALVLSGDYIVSRHGFRELAADDIVAEDAISGVALQLQLKIIRIRTKNRPCWPWSVTEMVGRFMSCGAFPKPQERQPYR